MKKIFFLAMSAGMCAGCATTSTTSMSAEERLDQAQTITQTWHAYSKVRAGKLLDEYGPPDQIESDRLIWHDAGPWVRIAVWDTEDYYPATIGSDNMEQTISYDVPTDKRAALAAFSDKLAVSVEGQELSVRGNSETLDFLALNLANEIVRGDRSPEQARRFYDRIHELTQAGTSSPYTQGLLFSPSRVLLPRSSEERSDFLNTPLDIWQY